MPHTVPHTVLCQTMTSWSGPHAVAKDTPWTLRTPQPASPHLQPLRRNPWKQLRFFVALP